MRSVRSGWQESSRAWHSRICIGPSSAQSCGRFHAELPCYMPAPANGCASCNWFHLNRGSLSRPVGVEAAGIRVPHKWSCARFLPVGCFRNLEGVHKGTVPVTSLNTGTVTSVAEQSTGIAQGPSAAWGPSPSQDHHRWVRARARALAQLRRPACDSSCQWQLATSGNASGAPMDLPGRASRGADSRRVRS